MTRKSSLCWLSLSSSKFKKKKNNKKKILGDNKTGYGFDCLCVRSYFLCAVNLQRDRFAFEMYGACESAQAYI